MKKITILIVSIALFGQIMQAQSIERDVIGSSGEAVSNNAGTLSYTLGETITLTSTDDKLTQGFQQTNEDATVSTIDLTKYTDDIVAYPNPAISYLKLRSSKSLMNYNFSIVDMQGKVVKQGSITSDSTIDVSDLACSTYTLVLNDTESLFSKKIRFVKMFC
jgi:hypothetical protein